MYKWICKFALKRTSRQFQLTLAKDITEEIQASKDYRINNAMAEKIIEAVVKSSGNKICDFIVEK